MNIFLGCVKSKRNKRSKAKDLYTSALFTKALAYARTLADDDDIYILSAKHGLLRLEDPVDPYEVTLNGMSERERKRWSYNTFKQIEKEMDIDEKTIFLCGMNYRKYIIRKFTDVEVPIEGKRIGEQLAFFTNEIKRNG